MPAMPNATRVFRAGAIAGTVLSLAAAHVAAAQADLASQGAPLARRVAAAPDGTVRLTYALRPDVCGSGNSIRVRGSRGVTTWNDDGRRSRDVDWDVDCESGPVRIVLDVRGGQVQSLDHYVGGRWRQRDGVTDLGAVPAAQAAGYLLTLAEQGRGKVSRESIFPATLADSVTTWPVLLRLARTSSLDHETRSQAVFWLGNAAGDAATKGLTELADDGDKEVRNQAVFALSRRPADEGVPILIRIARTHRDPEVRRNALFWLGRSEDPRALALFEELLTKR